jgi:hypothetical protein
MLMLVQVAAAVLLLLGSGLIFYALMALDRSPEPVGRLVVRKAPRPRPSVGKLPRAA